MTAAQLKLKIDSILAAYPSAVYTTANEGIIYVFTDGVLKTALAADIRVDVNVGKVWLLEGISI
jgi:hypothetical protein